MAGVTPTNIIGDAHALLATAAADPAARGGKVGVVGFCMSGGLSLALAKALPDRVAAAASIHGAWMVRDASDSPHLGLRAVQAEVYLGWADNDATAPPEQLAVVRSELDAGGVRYAFDFYTDAVHGYAPPGTERYNRAASEQHWERARPLVPVVNQTPPRTVGRDLRTGCRVPTRCHRAPIVATSRARGGLRTSRRCVAAGRPAPARRC